MESADTMVQDALRTGILVHLGGNEANFKCTVCLCLLSGPAPAAEHLRGESHTKVYRRHISSDNPALTQHKVDLAQGQPEEIMRAIDGGYLRLYTRDGQLIFHCDLCQAPMTGTLPTLHHLKGDKHERRSRSYNIDFSRFSNDAFTSNASCPVGYGEPRDASSHEVDLDEELDRGTLEKKMVMGTPHYTCTVCAVTMTGKEPTLSHFNGKSHKKVYNRKRLSGNMSTPLSNTSLSSINSSFEGSVDLTTQLGSDSFNSQLSASLARLDLSRDTDVVSGALLTGVLVEVRPTNFVCQVCSTGAVMCGRAPAQAHLCGQSHAKALAKVRQKHPQQLAFSTVNKDTCDDSVSVQSSNSSGSDRGALSRVASRTLGPDVTSTSNKDNPQDDLAAALADQVLVLKGGLEKYECTVCKKAMTGKIPAAAHLQGAAHLKCLKSRFLRTDDDSSSSSSGSYVSCADSSSSRVSSALTSGAIDEVKLHCKVCSVSFRSRDELIRHASCETHFNNHKKWEEKKKPVEAVIKCTSAILSSMPVDAGQLDLMAYLRRGDVQVLVRGERESYKCVPCQTELSSPSHLRAHLLGRAHVTAGKFESPRAITPSAPPAVTARVSKQERDDGDPPVSAASVADDMEQIVIGESDTPDTCPAFLALLDRIKHNHAKKKNC